MGALLVAPHEPGCAAGVVFFDNAGTLGMCGHGTIGLVATLAHLGRIGAGRHRIDTPVGAVEATLHDDGRVTIANVPSYRHARDVRVDVPGHGDVVGRRRLGRELVLPRARARPRRSGSSTATR